MAGTWADVLALMEIVDNELETGSGEDDESRAIVAGREAQHYFENLAATYPRILQTVTNSTTTTANQETTTWPTSLIRLDLLQLLNADGKVIREIEDLQKVGAHAPALPWPLTLVTAGSGAPSAFYANMANFYWLPLPDASHTIRIYGLFKQTEPTARTDSFAYVNDVKLPIATFAARLLKSGLGDSNLDLTALAGEVFGPLLRRLSRFNRTRSASKHYEYLHVT